MQRALILCWNTPSYCACFVVSLQEIGYNGAYISTTTDTNLADCCTSCSLTYGCAMYQYFDSPTIGRNKRAIKGFINGTRCYLLAGGTDFRKNRISGAPYAGTQKLQLGAFKKIDASWYVSCLVGGRCRVVSRWTGN